MVFHRPRKITSPDKPARRKVVAHHDPDASIRVRRGRVDVALPDNGRRVASSREIHRPGAVGRRPLGWKLGVASLTGPSGPPPARPWFFGRGGNRGHTNDRPREADPRRCRLPPRNRAMPRIRAGTHGPPPEGWMLPRTIQAVFCHGRRRPRAVDSTLGQTVLAVSNLPKRAERHPDAGPPGAAVNRGHNRACLRTPRLRTCSPPARGAPSRPCRPPRIFTLCAR